MSKKVESSVSVPMQVKEASSCPDRTFTVGFQPAHQFLAGLMILSNLNPTAAMTVKNGEIHLSATSITLSAYGTFFMLDASTAASWTSRSFALSFDTSNWRTLLTPSIYQQDFESLWIYKIGRSPDVYCLVGEDSEPIKLGEAKFVEEGLIDMRILPTHKVTINLETKCLREVLNSLTSKFYHVAMMVKEDSITWRNLTAELTHHEENSDCIIDGVGPGEIWYLLIEWRDPRFLMIASWLAEDVDIDYLDDPDWRDWSLFTFTTGKKTSFLYMFRGSDSLLLYGL